MAAEISNGAELPPPTYSTGAEHEAVLTMWGLGWDACASWLLPILERSRADADRYWAAAFAPTDKPKHGPSYPERRQATTELQERRACEWQESRG